MASPTGVQIDSDGDLWVCDRGYSRVLRFIDAANKSDGANADAVLGQIDFDSTDSGTSAIKLSAQFLSSLFLDALGNLWTTDHINNRVLRFTRPVAPTPPPTVTPDTIRRDLDVRGRKTIETLRKRVVIRRTASDDTAISEIIAKARGAKLKKVRGTTSWKAILRVTKDTGRVVVKIRSVDPSGNTSRVSRVRILRR